MALGGGPHIWSPGTPDPGSLDHVPGGVQTPILGVCIMMSSMCIVAGMHSHLLSIVTMALEMREYCWGAPRVPNCIATGV